MAHPISSLIQRRDHLRTVSVASVFGYPLGYQSPKAASSHHAITGSCRSHRPPGQERLTSALSARGHHPGRGIDPRQILTYPYSARIAPSFAMHWLNGSRSPPGERCDSDLRSRPRRAREPTPSAKRSSQRQDPLSGDDQLTVIPPSTAMSAPVIAPEAVEQSHTTEAATSPGSISRPIGCWAANASELVRP